MQLFQWRGLGIVARCWPFMNRSCAGGYHGLTVSPLALTLFDPAAPFPGILVGSTLQLSTRSNRNNIGHDGLRQDLRHVEEEGTNRAPRESGQGSVAPGCNSTPGRVNPSGTIQNNPPNADPELRETRVDRRRFLVGGIGLGMLDRTSQCMNGGD
jgi:hypothetical protein